MFNSTEIEKINNKWREMEYILSSNDFNYQFLFDNNHIKEIEHQVGRYLNMQKIFTDLDINGKNSIKGDVVEFGTWQGLGLIYFSRLLGDNINNRKIIGIDSFEGLPHNSTIWRKGLFSNTEIESVFTNFNKYADQRFCRDNILLIKGWFNSVNVKTLLENQVKKIALIHFDADLGSSTTEALTLVEPYLLKYKEPVYFLFDDWGCHPDEVPAAFTSWVQQFTKKIPITVEYVSSTRFTRYFKINFN